MVVTPAQLNRISQVAQNAATPQTSAAKPNVMNEQQFSQALDNPSAPRAGQTPGQAQGQTQGQIQGGVQSITPNATGINPTSNPQASGIQSPTAPTNVPPSNVQALNPQATQATKPPNLGERILANMQRASSPPPMVAPNAVSSSNAMEAQYKLTAFSIASQLESKAVGSASKSVQSLIKMQ